MAVAFAVPCVCYSHGRPISNIAENWLMQALVSGFGTSRVHVVACFFFSLFSDGLRPGVHALFDCESSRSSVVDSKRLPPQQHGKAPVPMVTCRVQLPKHGCQTHHGDNCRVLVPGHGGLLEVTQRGSQGPAKQIPRACGFGIRAPLVRDPRRHRAGAPLIMNMEPPQS